MIEFSTIVSICSGVMTIIGLVTFFVKPIREKVLKTKQHEKEQQEQINNLQSIVLASGLNTMTNIYYEAQEKGYIKKYQYESFDYIYKSYRKLNGNHFAEKLKTDIDKLRIVEG